MQAVRIIENNNDFITQDIDAPDLREGGAIVRMQAAFVASYMAALPSGAWMTPPRPFIPGQCAIGVVERASGGLMPGQRVYFDAYTGSNDPDVPREDHGFLGCFAVAPGAQEAMSAWPDGSFANLIHAPEDNFVSIPDEIGAPPEILCRLGWFGTALAGLERGGFRPGTVLAINGATGQVGAGAAAVALALGAAEVQVFGRREGVLQNLVALDPERVRIGDPTDGAKIDMLLDCASGETTQVTESLISRLRRYGVASFVGALTAPLPVDASLLMRNGNALVGSFWFTRDTLHRLFGLIVDGRLDLSPFTASCFALPEIHAAISHAQADAGGLNHTALLPEKVGE
ncbi:Alcohol dehydrogenase [Roseovarius sp. THAF27]|uniref:alcohol dehydrogenase catalytic domain-containing protein n=1 Tax=Roseovarius sp. THAF27 TaxID=2587850 RepID=UPI0012A94910|nr:hypothetical protein [Roseovarius sp. THAF27]QFT81986.1 Alcohol dehydrogenase [Roseovarius sp. THAF27]